jgi:hypothetical protein
MRTHKQAVCHAQGGQLRLDTALGLSKGQEATISYGPQQGEAPRQLRQQQLQQQYCFSCGCTACSSTAAASRDAVKCGLACGRPGCTGAVLPPADLPEGLVAVHPLRGSGRCEACGAVLQGAQEGLRKLAAAQEQYTEAQELLKQSEQLAGGGGFNRLATGNGSRSGTGKWGSSPVAALPAPLVASGTADEAPCFQPLRDAAAGAAGMGAGSSISAAQLAALGKQQVAQVAQQLQAAGQHLRSCLALRAAVLHQHNMLVAQTHDLAAQVAQALRHVSRLMAVPRPDQGVSASGSGERMGGAGGGHSAGADGGAVQQVARSVAILQLHYPPGAPALVAQQAWLRELQAEDAQAA